MKKLIENWNKHLSELVGEEEGEEEQPQTDIRTADGKKVQKMIGRLDNPKEFVDFFVLLKSVIANPDIHEKLKMLARKSGYDTDDLVAIKRLSDAFNKKGDAVEEEDAE